MHYRLSTFANRVSGKNCYTVEKGGSVLKNQVFRFSGDNIKENALECVYRGLKAVSGIVTHDDVVLIEVQNIHLCEWLMGMKEYDGYNEKLDKVFEVLEGMDCRYRFVLEKKPHAKEYGSMHDVQKMSFSSIDDMMDMDE